MSSRLLTMMFQGKKTLNELLFWWALALQNNLMHTLMRDLKHQTNIGICEKKQLINWLHMSGVVIWFASQLPRNHGKLQATQKQFKSMVYRETRKEV